MHADRLIEMTPVDEMKKFSRKLVLLLLRGYKWGISPMLRPACRYIPTCSEYAMEAVERYGVMYGGMKAVWRLLRCHPFAKGGFDPVAKRARGPETITAEAHEFCSH
jgi:uncharacterized protein